MSLQSQMKNMKLLYDLLSVDLGYIGGERESGPNGAKKQFLSTGRAFLTAMGKDLGFTEQRVTVNQAGIACSGEVTLMGLWGEKNGLSIQLAQDMIGQNCILYRTIEHRKDYRGGRNNFIPLAELRQADYAGMILEFLRFKESCYERRAA